MITRQKKLDRNFLRIAYMAAINLSKDPCTRVGAVITSADSRQVSLGYNGFPAGVDESVERWQRPEKYEWVIHAEMNAVINAPFDTKNCYLYSTHQPCHRCMVHLVNTGIKRIVYYEAKPDDRPDIFREVAKSFDEVLHFESDELIEMLKKFNS